MAMEPRQFQTVLPTGGTGDAFRSVGVNVRGADTTAVGEGLQQVGQGALRASGYFAEVAADSAVTEYQERVEKIMHGTGEVGPDGKADTGFMGLRGRAALDARPDADKRMEDLRREIESRLPTIQMRNRFTNNSRRLKSWADGRMGQHADTQANVWYDQVDKASADNWQNHIARNPNDLDAVLNGREELRKVYVQRAQRMGGGPELVKQAMERADREAIVSQASAISVSDPLKAMRIIENNRDSLGAYYDDLSNRFRSRAEQQDGRETADWMLTGAPPPKGDDSLAVVRHFEGFREKAYWDVNHWRTGYGSDTVTKADGTVVPVTPDTVVTRADAERDLERRVGLSQKQVQQAIGRENWERLSPQAQASVTSIAYNYGRVPDEITSAIRSGGDLGQAIRSLGRHNNGVNARRRASEAANITGESVAGEGTHEELIDQIKARHMPAAAESAAIARVNQSYRMQNAVETKRRADFKEQIDRSNAEAAQTGVTQNPIPESDFVKHYGAADGPARFAKYESDQVYYADRNAIEEMSDVEQQQFLDRPLPDPGQRGYSYAVTRRDQLRKDVAKMQEFRRVDPSGAVAKNPAVQAAWGQYDPKRPETFQPIAAARLAAQERLGIEPEYRSPITKAEALKMMTPVLTALPGGALEALEKVGAQFRTQLGDGAAQAFVYALRASHANAEAMKDAGNILRDLTEGRPISPEEKRADQATKDAVETDRMRPSAMGGAVAPATLPPTPGDQPAWVESPEYSPSESYKPAPKGPALAPKPTPNNDDIRRLRDGGVTPQQFDTVFGAGAAKKLMEEYPFFFRGR